VAEVAIVVADDLQDRGVGTRLGQELVEAAVARGVARFRATVLPSSRAAARLFAKISQQLDVVHGRGADEFVAPLAAA
jgi:L-amino acid N-acyltransferase YncA